MTADGARPRVGEVMIEAGLLTEEQLAHALAEQRRLGRPRGEIVALAPVAAEAQPEPVPAPAVEPPSERAAPEALEYELVVHLVTGATISAGFHWSREEAEQEAAELAGATGSVWLLAGRSRVRAESVASLELRPRPARDPSRRLTSPRTRRARPIGADRGYTRPRPRM